MPVVTHQKKLLKPWEDPKNPNKDDSATTTRRFCFGSGWVAVGLALALFRKSSPWCREKAVGVHTGMYSYRKTKAKLSRGI